MFSTRLSLFNHLKWRIEIGKIISFSEHESRAVKHACNSGAFKLIKISPSTIWELSARKHFLVSWL